MTTYVLDLADLGGADPSTVGGKGTNLGVLRGVRGVSVPPGFCVTTRAFTQFLDSASGTRDPLRSLARLRCDEHASIRAVSAALRELLSTAPIDADVAEAIARAHDRFGAQAAFAVRSSATAEDQPSTSFAGQHESYLNIIGRSAILEHVRRCWASLFTERAIAYRLRHGINHEHVQMAVVVQQMVFPRTSGVLFTADPVTGHRQVARIEATFGLGEALVAGMVEADSYTVGPDEVLGARIGAKRVEIVPSPVGGTVQQNVEGDRQRNQVLTPTQILQLATIGRRIEARFGTPQDVEWALDDTGFHIVQSRPITTLFPVPDGRDGSRRVFVSVGHQQMMTDAMKPLGLSMWQLKAGRPMHEAAGRFFVDVTDALAAPSSRAALLGGLGKSEQLIGDALRTLLARGDFPVDDSEVTIASAPDTQPAAIATDPTLVTDLIARFEDALQGTRQGIHDKTGSALLDFIHQDITELKQLLFDPTSMQVIFAGIEAAWWLNEHLEAWLGDRNAADTLSLSVSGNVTSEMGLALLEVADVIRPYTDVVTFLEQTGHPHFLHELPRLIGGQEVQEAMHAWLTRHGVRGVGEIDITRPRFSERPDMLLPMLLGNVRHLSPGAGARRFEQGRDEATRYAAQVLERLETLPDGAAKAARAAQMIERVRTYAGYREYPKYAMVSRDFVYKQALLAEAERLVRAGVMDTADDVFYLRFDELQEAVRAQHVSAEILRERKDAFRIWQTLTPPRVITSDGECISGDYRRDQLPAGALCGLPVSPGIVEGRVRVITDLTQAHVEPGDILVTAYTDPSWTPLFLSIAGLITEVGGLMTHGAVIAREYGLPAIVGVDRATERLRDGQRVRLHATDGYVVEISDHASHTPGAFGLEGVRRNS